MECLVALAFAATVFPPASAALRAAVRRESATASVLAAAAARRPAVLSAEARDRLFPDPERASDAAGGDFGLSDL